MKNSSNLSLDPKCEGCEKIIGAAFPNGLCSTLLEPAVQWTKLGGCHMRTHNRVVTDDKTKVFVDPLKKSKQEAKARLKMTKKTVTPDKKKKQNRRDSR